MSGSDRVVLVDLQNQPVGVAGKLAAHESPGHLHRAVSVFVLDSAGRMLLQRRAREKYHFAGCWANAACSHPRPGESVGAAGRRRLREEMGLALPLVEVGRFVYRAEDPETGLVEHEFDHVLLGISDQDPQMNPAEVDAWDRVDPVELWGRLREGEAGFAPWLGPALEAVPRLRGV